MTLAATKAEEREAAARIERVEEGRMLLALEQIPGATIPQIAKWLQRAGEFLLVDPWYRRADRLVESDTIERDGTTSAAHYWLAGRRPEATCSTTTTTTTHAPTAAASTAPATKAPSPTTTAAPVGAPAAATSATACPSAGIVPTPLDRAGAAATDGADSKPREPSSATDASGGGSSPCSPPDHPTPTTSPSDSEHDMTQTEAILDYLRANPGALSSSVGTKLRITQAATALRRLQNIGVLRSEAEGEHITAPRRWWVVEPAEKPTEEPLTRDLLRALCLECGVVDGRVDEEGLCSGCGGEVVGLYGLDSLEAIQRLAARPAPLLQGETSDHATAVRERDQAMAQLRAVEAIVADRAKLRDAHARPDAVRLAASPAEPIAPPSIDGVPYPAALALIASAAGIGLDYADGWPTISPRTLAEIVRAAGRKA